MNSIRRSGFETFDEYELLVVPGLYQELGSDYRGVILHAFKGNGDTSLKHELLFALIEKVTIRHDLNSVGEVFVYSDQPREQVRLMISNYVKIVGDMKEDPRFWGGVSSFLEWYDYRTYLLLRENSRHLNSKVPGQRSWIEFQEQKDRIVRDIPTEHYITNIGPISEQFVQEYMDLYGDRIQEIGLNSFPYSAVVIKPMVIRNPETGHVQPLGSLYMHFGTRTFQSQAFYADLMNRVALVWMRNEGEDLLKYIKNAVRSEMTDEFKRHQAELLKFERELERHLPELSENSLEYGHYRIKVGIKPLFTSYLRKKDQVRKIKEYGDFQSGHAIFEQLFLLLAYSSLNTPKKEEYKVPIEGVRHKLMGMQDSLGKLSRVITSVDADDDLFCFHRILQARKVALYCLLCLDFTFFAIHQILTGEKFEVYTNGSTPNLETAYHYRWKNLFLNWKVGAKNKINLQEKQTIYERCSRVEQQVLRDIHRKIRSKYLSGKAGTFSLAEQQTIRSALSETLMQG